ncbi:hypothetical protein [Pseudolabrys sp.]|uniref:hypothetical protein n=1 Tax=Pseudolabrys sp. TaxID=1960880 RepID=UPI003D0F3B1F
MTITSLKLGFPGEQTYGVRGAGDEQYVCHPDKDAPNLVVVIENSDKGKLMPAVIDDPHNKIMASVLSGEYAGFCTLELDPFVFYSGALDNSIDPNPVMLLGVIYDAVQKYKADPDYSDGNWVR